MRKLFNRAVFVPLLMLIGLQAHASTWTLDPNQSRVFFKYSYKGTPYKGEFKNVEAVFEIDPRKPGSCK